MKKRALKTAIKRMPVFIFFRVVLCVFASATERLSLPLSLSFVCGRTGKPQLYPEGPAESPGWPLRSFHTDRVSSLPGSVLGVGQQKGVLVPVPGARFLSLDPELR